MAWKNARTKFAIGQRVRMTRRALRMNLAGNRTAASGTVTGYGRISNLQVRVRVDGNKHPSGFHMDFWRAE